MKDTSTREYSARLVQKQYKLWKKLFNVQLPYKWNLKRLELGYVLDIGCGIGRNLKNLCGKGVGVDYNKYAVDEARIRGFSAYTNREFRELFRSEEICFDSILVSHVIEHTGFDEGLNLLKEHLPYLKDGGKVVLITPQAKGYRTDPTHVEFIDFKKQKKMIHMADLRMQKQYSFPFPVLVGNFFPYNEFISVGIKTDQGFDSDAE